MKLFCDEMLQGLGRWLRTAGYDTAIASGGTSDRVLIERAVREGRVLLTCDRALAEVRRRLGVDWLHRPLSRCLRCNSELRPANQVEVAALPPDSSRGTGPFTACPTCLRVYWPGSHVRRMRTELARLQAVAAQRARPRTLSPVRAGSDTAKVADQASRS